MPKYVRTLRARLDPAETSDRTVSRRRQRPALPSPLPVAVALAITVVEVEGGVRPAGHLEAMCHHSLWQLLPALRGPTAHDVAWRPPRPLVVAVQEQTPGLVDVAVVLDVGGYAEAVAFRLDGALGRWELMELTYRSSVAPGIPTPLGHAPPAPLPAWARGVTSILDGTAVGAPRVLFDPADYAGIELE